MQLVLGRHKGKNIQRELNHKIMHIGQRTNMCATLCAIQVYRIAVAILTLRSLLCHRCVCHVGYDVGQYGVEINDGMQVNCNIHD